MDKSEQLNELFSALSKAQSLIKGAPKDAQNPFFKSHYTTLDACWEACRGPLGAQGLTVTQIVEDDGTKMYLITILGHASGQYISSKVPLLLVKQDPQSLGSCLSYMRRYSLCAIVGLTQSDDDGEQATQPYRETVSPKKMSAVEFLVELRGKVKEKYDFCMIEAYLNKLEEEKNVPVSKIMEQALAPSLVDRFCRGYQTWYEELNKS